MRKILWPRSPRKRVSLCRHKCAANVLARRTLALVFVRAEKGGASWVGAGCGVGDKQREKKRAIDACALL